MDSVNCPETSPLLPPAPKRPKTSAERQREYRLRQKNKILNNVEREKRKEALRKKNENQRQSRHEKKIIDKNKNEDKPAKKTRADYQREYRLRKKKRNSELNYGLAEVIPKQVAGSSGYLAQSTQLSPDAGPIIIHSPLLPPAPKKTKTSAERQREYRLRQKNKILNNVEREKRKGEYIENEDGIIMYEESISEDDSSHPYFRYRSHQSAHKQFKTMFVENSFDHVCNVYDRLWFLKDLKSGSPDEENLLKQITLPGPSTKEETSEITHEVPCEPLLNLPSTSAYALAEEALCDPLQVPSTSAVDPLRPMPRDSVYEHPSTQISGEIVKEEPDLLVSVKQEIDYDPVQDLFVTRNTLGEFVKMETEEDLETCVANSLREINPEQRILVEKIIRNALFLAKSNQLTEDSHIVC